MSGWLGGLWIAQSGAGGLNVSQSPVTVRSPHPWKTPRSFPFRNPQSAFGWWGTREGMAERHLWLRRIA